MRECLYQVSTHISKYDLRANRDIEGATIIANVWYAVTNASCEVSLISQIRAMMHDESTYENSFEFNPDRFDCEHPPRDPHLMAFGFGRR